MNRSVCLALALLLSLVAMKEATYKVFRGKNVPYWGKNPYKFIVMLAGGGSVCTGSLYNQFTVASAGHCFTDLIPKMVVFEHTNMGVYFKKSVEFEKYHISPEFEATYKKQAVSGLDFAVVTMKESCVEKSYDVTMGEFQKHGRPAMGSEVVIVGYGKNSAIYLDSGSLHIGHGEVRSCVSARDGEPICVFPVEKHRNQIAEQGDSGGPLLFKREGKILISGFLSGSVTETTGEHYIMYSKSSYHLKYLEQNAKNENGNY